MMARTGRVLLVDDHESVRITLAALLEDEGYEVAEASDLESAREHLSGRDSYVLILLDAHLGNESGLDLVDESRAHSAGAFIVLLTGDSELIDSGVEGVDAVINKAEGIDSVLAAFDSRGEP